MLAAVTPRTRLALLDHVTSPTARIFPLAEIIAALSARGVPVLVDGAHAPGTLPLDLPALGADYYTGNLHKWICGPRAVGFLYVKPELQEAIQPAGDQPRLQSPPARLAARCTIASTGRARAT